MTDEIDGWVPPDIDETQTIERLGDEGYKMVCQSFDGYIHDIYRSQFLIKAACTAHALQTTTDATACAASTAQCIDTLPPVVEKQLSQIVVQAGCNDESVAPSRCRSPVSALLRCLRDLRGIVDSTGKELTCATFGSPLRENWWRLSTPKSCVALGTSCPP